MTETPLEALIARLEAATGPDRELDAAISEAAGTEVKKFSDGWFQLSPYQSPGGKAWMRLLAYTESLDTALSLVPEGFHWSVSHNGDGTYEAGICDAERVTKIAAEGIFARTPALALCIAALRARAALPREEG